LDGCPRFFAAFAQAVFLLCCQRAPPALSPIVLARRIEAIGTQGNGTMTGTIFVINPNSSESVTAKIDDAVKPLRSSDGPDIECVTLAEGPPAVESQRDADSVPGPLLRTAARLENAAAAFVVACFSDPGLHSLREQSRRPVLGIAESGILTALTLGQRFGVIAILATSIPRHLRYYGAMGVTSRLAGELPAGLRVHELANPGRTLRRMTEVGQSLRDDRGADVLVMGCAGMAPYREQLEMTLGIPVVEPTQAAVTMAVGRVRLGWNGRVVGEGAAAAGTGTTSPIKAAMSAS
jgi:allantoin racemase